MGSLVSVVYRKGQRTMEVLPQTYEEPLKRWTLWMWGFASNELNGEMSRLYKTPCECFALSMVSGMRKLWLYWAGDRQIIPQKSLGPFLYHPAPATSSPPLGLILIHRPQPWSCAYSIRVWNLLLWGTRSGMLSNYMEAERLPSLPWALQKLP